MDLALNNLQWLMCHKIKPNQTHLHRWFKECNKINSMCPGQRQVAI